MVGPAADADDATAGVCGPKNDSTLDDKEELKTIKPENI